MDRPIVLAGPPAAGKTTVRRLLIQNHNYTPGQILEAHIWDINEPLQEFEVMLRTPDDMERLSRRLEGADYVLVWLDAAVIVRHKRLGRDLMLGRRRPEHVPSLERFKEDHLAPWSEQELGNAPRLPAPDFVRGEAQQIIFNTGTLKDLEQYVSRLVTNCRSGAYLHLLSGQRAASLGDPRSLYGSGAARYVQAQQPVTLELPPDGPL